MLINVLMSTFNGEKYVKEQIEAIINQKMVNTTLTIRDDGSIDKTISLVKSMQEKYPGRIKLFKGENVGYAKSFMILLRLAEENVDYYAFSDQDDLWMKNKLIVAAKHLNKIENAIALYASSVYFCDEKLNILYVNHMNLKKQSLKSDFIRHSLSGCTMVFTKRLKELAESMVIDKLYPIPSHDFILSSIAFCVGRVYIDPKSYIYHRRHTNSVTAKANGIIDRVKTEYRVIFKQKNENYVLAKLLLNSEKISVCLKNDDRKFLSHVLISKKNFYKRISLIFSRKFTCGILLCDIETKFKILIGNY